MKHRLLILGSKGSMGKRYAAICQYLKIPFDAVDLNDAFDLNAYSRFIIATPTSEHIKNIRHIIDNTKVSRLRILCEKPVAICSNVLEGLSIIKDATFCGHEFFMVNQYAYYPGLTPAKDLTYYNYYNSGKDGLAWDCIQLIFLAKGEITLDNSSPIWECRINGTWLDRETLDECYIEMIDDFFRCTQKKLWGYDDIFRAHLKVIEYEKGSYRNSSQK